MSKLTLLEMTQSILNDMDSDSVNSIDDSEESIQVALIVKTSYYKLMARQDWPFLRSLTTLTGLGDTANPTKMLIPETVSKLLWIRYDGERVTYMPPDQFKELIDNREVQTGVIDANGYIINADPQYWTTYDDTYVVFDGYDSAAETTLQTANTAVYCVVDPTWTHTDSFTPTMPAKMFPLLLAEAKSSCFLALKQQANAKEENYAKTTRSQMQKEAWRADAGESTYNSNINYGRK